MEILTGCAYQLHVPDNNIIYLAIQPDDTVLAYMNGKLAMPETLVVTRRTRRLCRNEWKRTPPAPDHRSYVLEPRRQYRVAYDGAVLAHVEPFGKSGWCVARTGAVCVRQMLDDLDE